MILRGAEGYEVRSDIDSEGFVWSAGADWLAATLAGGNTLHGWAAGHDHVVSFTGRGTVHAVPAPAVVAGATYSAGMFYRADLATELIPDAESLADLLFGNSDSQVDVEKALHVAGKVVRKLEDTRVLHPDVNAGNILLRIHLGEIEAHVIDLDRCNILPQATPGPHHFMRGRLERSLQRLADRHAVELPDGCWRALRDGFGES